MFSRFASPLSRRLGAVGRQFPVRKLGTTSPTMIRIKKSSESSPDSSKEPKNDTTKAPEEPKEPKVEPTASPSPSSSASKKNPNVSPFGFSSAGGGMAKGLLGEDPTPASEDSTERGEVHQNGLHRDSKSAAEARRARRQRADLPPLEDDPKLKAAKYILTGLMFGLLIGGFGYYGRPYSKEETEKGLKDDPSKNAVQQLWQRTVKRSESAFTFLSEPATEKLLPDPNEYTMPYTLVLNLDDMLIHMDWSKEHGWRIAKRPGLDHFLAYMASMFEVVIFSTQPSHSGMLVLERLDPLEYAPFRLYKDHMRNVDGKNYKDLSTINRDMSRVIMIDITPDSLKMQPENVLLGRPFNGKAGDNWIEQITEFLEYIHMMEPKDVRPWIKTYSGMDAAREFTKWEDSIRQRLVEEWEEKRKNAGSWKSWVFGGVPSDMENPPIPEFDQMRKMMRENFEVQHKEVLAIIEKERKQNEEEMQRQMKDMTVWKMMTQMVNGPPPGLEGPVGSESSSAANPQASK